MPPLGILFICLHDTIKVKYVQVFICCLYILFGHTLPYLPFIQPCAIIRCMLFIKRGVDTMKIMITGIGGVGGYIASVLCANYDDVTLVARRKRKESLQTKGLVVHSDFFGDHVAHPAVTDDPSSAGIQDVIFVCVKNYSLEAVLTAVLPCIGDDTIVVPVLNGFTYHDTATSIMKNGKIVDSAIYITSSYQEDYSIRQEGRFARIYIGSDDAEATKKVYDQSSGPDLLHRREHHRRNMAQIHPQLRLQRLNGILPDIYRRRPLPAPWQGRIPGAAAGSL